MATHEQAEHHDNPERPVGPESTMNIQPRLSIIVLIAVLAGCSPEVGSDAWCEEMAEKDAGDWTANEAADFARSCVFKSYEDE